MRQSRKERGARPRIAVPETLDGCPVAAAFKGGALAVLADRAEFPEPEVPRAALQEMDIGGKPARGAPVVQPKEGGLHLLEEKLDNLGETGLPDLVPQILYPRPVDHPRVPGPVAQAPP